MADLLIANVLSRGHLSMTSEAIIDRLKGRFDVEAHVVMPTLDKRTGFVLAVDGTQVAVIIEHEAMPLAELEPLHGDRRDVDGPLLQHRSHATVSPLNFPDEQSEKIRATLSLVQTIASIVEESEASAVLWSFSQALVSAEQFLQLTLQWSKLPENVPLLLLTRVAAYSDGAVDGVDRYGMFGVGFRPFFGHDIEFLPDSLELDKLAYGFELVARWLMLKGLVFKDGDTCGVSTDERIRIHYANPGRAINGPALMCKIEKIDVSVGKKIAESLLFKE